MFKLPKNMTFIIVVAFVFLMLGLFVGGMGSMGREGFQNCPGVDMSKYMLKTECPPQPDMSKYVLKSSIPKCPPCIASCSKPCNVGACPPCPRPRCPSCPKCEQKPCPPCPDCPRPRCPEPEIKVMTKYRNQPGNMPRPVLTSISAFDV